MKRRKSEHEPDAAKDARTPAPAAPERRAPPRLAPGDWFLRRFRVERLLGEGGMGAVYAVAERGRRWALKLVRSELVDDPYHRRRLLREGDVLVRMRHPNIVEVHETGITDDGIAWYRMELLDGMTLRDELSRRRVLSLPLACATLRAAALGAGHLHAFGAVHRDIKPENLFVTRGERNLKLLDLGLARLVGTPDTLDAQTHGTPLYMAPEQIRDEVATPATDVYALGLVAYEAIAGFHPFGGGRASVPAHILFTKHIYEAPPPLSQLGVPKPISDAIARAVGKVPRERHRDGIELAEALWNAFLASGAEPKARDTNPGEPQMSEVLRWGNQAPPATTGPAAGPALRAAPAAEPERAIAPDASPRTGPRASGDAPLRGPAEGPASARPTLAERAAKAEAQPVPAEGAARAEAQRMPAEGAARAEAQTVPADAGATLDATAGGIRWAVTERLSERLRDPSCVAALAGGACAPEEAPHAPAWIPVATTIRLSSAAGFPGRGDPEGDPAADGRRLPKEAVFEPEIEPMAGPELRARNARPDALAATASSRRARTMRRAAAIGLLLVGLVGLLVMAVVPRSARVPPVVPASSAPKPAAAGASRLPPAGAPPVPSSPRSQASIQDTAALMPLPSAGSVGQALPASAPTKALPASAPTKAERLDKAASRPPPAKLAAVPASALMVPPAPAGSAPPSAAARQAPRARPAPRPAHTFDILE